MEHKIKYKAEAVFGGGCFWCTEAVFEELRGVISVMPGYTGGTVPNPTYEAVCTGETGHAESVQITYNPAVISYETLLRVYFTVAHDPTEVNRQGPDDGNQYRSAIFYADAQQRATALAVIDRLTAAKAFKAPIATQVVPLHGFYAAEAYHQHYAHEHPDDPYIVINDAPKVAMLHSRYPELVK